MIGKALCGAWLLGGIVAFSGCAGLFFFTNPDASKEVKAKYNKIGDARLAVVVWADRSTLDEYPAARRQVCRAVTHHMKKSLEDAEFVTPKEIRKLQADSSRDWETMTPYEIARELGSDFVLRIDLLDFTTRASETRQLRKARVAATINLHDCRKDERLDAVYDDIIKTTFPPKSLHGVQDMTETDLLHEAVEHFAQATARKFYDHKVKLQSGPSW